MLTGHRLVECRGDILYIDLRSRLVLTERISQKHFGIVFNDEEATRIVIVFIRSRTLLEAKWYVRPFSTVER